MLPSILAIAVALGSFALFLGAFFFPKIHRQDDFLWSGVGLFYALVLWVCAGRLTGGVLLGQAAAASLLLVFGWQTLKLRQTIAYPGSLGERQEFSLTRWLGRSMGKKGQKPETATAAPEATAVAPPREPEGPEPAPTSQAPAPEPEAAAATVSPAAAPEPQLEVVLEAEAAVAEETMVAVSPAAAPEPQLEAVLEAEAAVAEETIEVVEAETTPETQPESQEKQGFLKNFFGFGKSKPEAKPESLTAALEEIEGEGELEEEDWETADEPTAAATAIEPEKGEGAEVSEVTGEEQETERRT